MKKKEGSYQAVYVEWLDSCMKTPVWFSTGELLEGTKSVRDTFKTVSYLVNQNKYEYIFASSIHFDKDNDAVSVGQIFTIPKGCVTKMIKIKIPVTKNINSYLN